MRQGTTPTHNFGIPFEIPEESKIRIVYAQNENVILERTTETCSVSNQCVSVTLTADETLRFDCSNHYINGRYMPYPVEIQIGIETPAGSRLWSEIITETVERCLRKDGVI